MAALRSVVWSLFTTAWSAGILPLVALICASSEAIWLSAASYCWPSAEMRAPSAWIWAFSWAALALASAKGSAAAGRAEASTVHEHTVTAASAGPRALRRSPALRTDLGVEWRRGRSTSVTMGGFLSRFGDPMQGSSPPRGPQLV